MACDSVSLPVNAKRKELEAKYKCKVNMAVLAGEKGEECCIVYFKAATTFTKMQCMDLAIQSPMKASVTMFDATVIKEESDTRVFMQDNDNDTYYLGAVQYCGELIRVARYLLKKLDRYYEVFEGSETLKKAALLRYYFHVDADKLSQERIEKLWIQLCYCLNWVNGKEE